MSEDEYRKVEPYYYEVEDGKSQRPPRTNEALFKKRLETLVYCKRCKTLAEKKTEKAIEQMRGLSITMEAEAKRLEF